MKFFDRFKNKNNEEKNELKSIFTDLDGKGDNSQSRYDRFNEYSKSHEDTDHSLREERVKYKTFDPYGDDEARDEHTGKNAEVITDDVINSVLSSITDNEAEVEGYNNQSNEEEIIDVVDEPVIIADETNDNAFEEDTSSTDDDYTDSYADDTVVEPQSNIDDVEQAIDITDDIVEEQIDEEDKDIYDNLFTETTIVGTQIYTYDIDKQLNGYNYISDVNYRVGTEHSKIGSIFTITKKKLNSPISINRSHTDNEVEYYNELAGLGYSYAAIRGTNVEGIVLCEPQYWNNTLAIRHITVVENSRKQGIARQMLLKVIESAQHNGFRGLYVEVGSKNGSAVDFFLHNHFHITGTNTILYSNSDILKNQVGIFLYRAMV